MCTSGRVWALPAGGGRAGAGASCARCWGCVWTGALRRAARATPRPCATQTGSPKDETFTNISTSAPHTALADIYAAAVATGRTHGPRSCTKSSLTGTECQLARCSPHTPASSGARAPACGERGRIRPLPSSQSAQVCSQCRTCRPGQPRRWAHMCPGRSQAPAHGHVTSVSEEVPASGRLQKGLRPTNSGRCEKTMEKAAHKATNVVQTEVK